MAARPKEKLTIQVKSKRQLEEYEKRRIVQKVKDCVLGIREVSCAYCIGGDTVKDWILIFIGSRI
jgi:hypothetical protein